jgi:hypothetical protein
MSEVVEQDGVISNCVGVKSNSGKVAIENCHKDTVSGGKTESSLKDLDLDEGELG